MLLPQFFPLPWTEDGFDLAHVAINPDIGLGIVERDGQAAISFWGRSMFEQAVKRLEACSRRQFRTCVRFMQER
jgi:hypothetical protein